MRVNGPPRLLLLACAVLLAHLALLTWMVVGQAPDTSPPAVLTVRMLPWPHGQTPSVPAPAAAPAQPRTPPTRPARTSTDHASVRQTRAVPTSTAAEPAAPAKLAPIDATAHESGPPHVAPAPAGSGNARAAAGALPVTTSGADGLELPSSKADYLNNPPPGYPAISRRLGEQGQVLIAALISKDGSVAQARIEHSSGFQRLDQAALETVRHWRFVPGRRAGVAQDMWFTLPITFTLD